MTVDEMVRHTERTSYTAYLIFEKPFQRFAEREMHLFRQTAYVMVRLDDFTRDIERFDSVRINGSLCKPLGTRLLLGFCIKDLNEVTSYDFTFLLGVGNACQVVEEFLACIDTDNVKSETLVVVHDIVELIFTEHAVINEDTCEVLTDSLI